jgi:hypothetical protein
MRKRRDKSIITLERQHLNLRILIGKRFAAALGTNTFHLELTKGGLASPKTIAISLAEGANIRQQSRIFANAFGSRRGDRSTVD